MAAAIVDTPIKAIPELVRGLRESFNRGTTKPLSYRLQQLNCIERMVNENEARLIDALKKDLGVNDFWTDGVELESIRGELALLKKNLPKWAALQKCSTPLINQPAASFLQPEPYGVVLIIAPWNYPASLTLVPFMTSLAAGNTTVIKPSEMSVHTSLLLQELCEKYLDSNCVAFVQGGVSPTTAVLEERFDFICYTGNGMVARIVHKAANRYLTPLLLELGGKCPAIVTPSANMSNTVKRIAWGKWTMNMGQTCISPDYVLTTPDKLDAVVAGLKKTLLRFYGEDPQTSKDISRLISVRHAERVRDLLLNDKDITILHGGQHDVANRYVAPTIVLAKPTAKCMQSEIFGPVLPIIVLENLDAMLAFINSRDKPLALYIFF